VHDGYGLITALQDGFPRLVGQCDLMLEEVGRGEGVVATNCTSRLELFLEDLGGSIVQAYFESLPSGCGYPH
jgi:hypothetical protein